MMATQLDDRPATARPHDRSLGNLFGNLAHEATTLVRQEIELARAEMGEKVATTQRAVMSMAAGGAVLHAGFLVLLLAAVVALDAVLDRWLDTNWLAPLVVGVVVTLAGYLMLKGGQKAMRSDALVPRRTLRSLRRDVRAVQQNGARTQIEPEEMR
jgi:xanthine/uracil permease